MSENRLSQTASPYLLQHKDNPVAWWPWSAEALAEAKNTNKPILLSIGYAACHWCHVMAHESFEDEDTARVMNELFVNIKVDREERPDIDQIYMNALHHLGEHGGWPLTMFLTPDGEPVWGGTYFPKTARYGKPAFVDILRELARIFRDEPEKVDQNRAALMQRLAERARPASIVTIGPRELDTVSERILQLIDMDHGGIGGAPKFPQCSALELLWRAGARTSDPRYAARVGFTLEKISEGGIYDHLGGGYSRYAVDARWLVPHFEKMLYDNAQLLELLALAYRDTDNPVFRARIFETVDWLKREMRNQEGAFAASLDADSEGEEGKFYVWTEAEIHDVLGDEDAAFFAEFYDVTPGGNWEGHTILNRLTAPARSKDAETRLTALRQKLLERRGGRVRPGLDDKILADWNGMMIAALAHVGGMMGEREFIDLAARAFHFIDRAMTVGDRLGHSWRDGHLLFPGLASDHVHMIRAALALHEVTAERIYLDRAVSWQNALDQHFANPNGYYFLTADDAEGLIVRPNATNDDALPNHNAIAAQNLVRLATLVGSDTFREAADRLFDGLLPLAGENLFAHAALLNALDLRLNALEIVVTGTSAKSNALANAALSLPFTNRMLLRATTKETLAPKHPARDKIEAAPDGTAFVCQGQTCSLPISDPDELRAALTTRIARGADNAVAPARSVDVR